VGFLAMMGQIPLVFLTGPFEKMRGPGTTIGNCIFWITFCLVGQPFGVLYYFYRFVLDLTFSNGAGRWNVMYGNK